MSFFDPQVFIRPLLVGIVATATLDLWAVALNRSFGFPVTNWGHVGRWVAGIPSGTFRHASIAAAPAVAGERIIGWITHYLIGIAYAVLYLMIMVAMSQPPSPGSAGLFGLVTVLAPWLILQPGLGIGFFARNAPNPRLARALNLLSHLAFGVGLYAGWLVLSFVA